MERILAVFCITVITFSCFGQKKKKPSKEERMSVKEEWNAGSVLTIDGTELKGLLWYNDHTNVLSLKDDLGTRAFSAKSVAQFTFFDASLQKQRVYYSIEYDNDDVPGGRRSYFFELLKEFKTFAVLLKSDPVEVKENYNPGPSSPGSYAPGPGTVSRHASQEEIVFLLNAKGEIEPYLKVVKVGSEDDYFAGSYTKGSKLINEDILAKFVTELVYSNLQAYAKLNKLKFRRKEDFLKILDYYAQNWADK